MTEEQLQRVMRRMKARLPAMKDAEFSVIDGGKLQISGPTLGLYLLVGEGWSENDVVEEFCELARQQDIVVLPEITLVVDTAVVLNGHQLRIAEQQVAVTSTPRVKVDPAEAYTAEEAEADFDRLAVALMHAYTEGAEIEHTEPWSDDPKPRAAEMRDASVWRREASLLLSKVKGWQRGAPPSSAGHQHARRVFEDPVLDALVEAADAAMEERVRDIADLQPPEPLKPGDVLVVGETGTATRWDYTVEDAEADIALTAAPLAAYAEDTGTDAPKAAEEAHRDAARLLLKLSPWRAAVPADSAGLVHVRQVAGGGE